MRVMILVTHLLGTGHLARARVLARAFVAAGDEVLLMSGGMPAPHLSDPSIPMLQLPALRSDGTDFARLLTQTGAPAGEHVFMDRRTQVQDAVTGFAPDVLITELFPFGRRSLRDEFIAALSAARNLPRQPRIYASVRDILAPPSKPRKATFADEMLQTFYDGVLVHADPSVVTLDASWPVSDVIAERITYTGFVAPDLPPQDGSTDGAAEILISAGGGSVGDTLFEAALEVAQNDTRTWRVLVGGHDAEARCRALQAKAPPNAIVEPARPDFRILLQRCAASISFAGYNTAMDVLQSGIPAVMVAFDDGAEVEQTLRAAALATLPQIETLPLKTVTTATLQDALHKVLSDDQRRTTAYDMTGAETTQRLCAEAAAR